MNNLKWVDDIINKIFSINDKTYGSRSNITENEIERLCKEIRPIFLEQPVLLELQTPLTICGDIHGQYLDLIRIFKESKYPPLSNYLFLGDYVDRGLQNIETICLLFAYKVKFPENFFLLRGNHECSYINRDFGFFDECKTRFSINLWRTFSDVFNCLPIAAIIENKIFCVHGGISPELTDLDQIREIQRPLEVPEEGLLCDLLWSDPSSEIEEWDENDRGASYIFGLKPVKEFLEKFDFELIVRAHQAITNGYEFPFLYDDDQSILTLFSAPNYCNEYMNKGAILNVNEDLLCSFNTMEPIKRRIELGFENRPGTPPRMSEQTLDNCQLQL